MQSQTKKHASSDVELTCFLWWAIGDSNPGPTGYEPVALTNWANGPKVGINEEYYTIKRADLSRGLEKRLEEKGEFSEWGSDKKG